MADPRAVTDHDRSLRLHLFGDREVGIVVSPMQSVPRELAVLIAVFAVASLMVFPIMPLTMKLLGSWVYKK